MKGVDKIKRKTQDGLLCKKPYRSTIRVNGIKIFIGYFGTHKDAAKAYDLFIITHNLNRKTNFIKPK